MADNNGGFLGGGPQFNKVGASAPDDGTTQTAASTPQSLQPYQIRNLIIVLVIVIMLAALFIMDYNGMAGVGHKTGSGQTLHEAPTPGKDF